MLNDHRVLWIGDSPVLNTGYAKVGWNVLTRLSKFCSVSCAGLFHPGKELLTELGFPIYPAGSDFGRLAMPAIIHAVKPTLIIGLGDFWMFDWWRAVDLKSVAPCLLYSLVDGKLHHSHFDKMVRWPDHFVAASHFTERVARDLPECPDISTIPFGVDANVFQPLPRGASMTSSVPVAPHIQLGLDNKFVVGCVARNQPRKQFPRLLHAFSLFCADKPEAMLYLHTSLIDTGWDLTELITQYGLEDKVIVPRDVSAHRGVEDDELCQLYNLFDVFALPTMGEGFGLPLLEAMACGVPVIATDCSAVTELISGRGELIRVKEWVVAGGHNVDQAVADTDHLVELLDKLYADPALRAEYGRRGRAFAQGLTWEHCVQQWLNLFETIEVRPEALAKPAARVQVNNAIVASASHAAPLQLTAYRDLLCAQTTVPQTDLPVQGFHGVCNETSTVVWRSLVFDATGYADEARNFIFPLSRRLKQLRLDMLEGVPERIQLSSKELTIIQRLVQQPAAKGYIEIASLTPSQFRLNEMAGFRVGRTMFEMLPLPAGWVEACEQMDEIWLPSSFCMHLFAACGVPESRLRLVRGGIDFEVFSPASSTSTATLPTAEVRSASRTRIVATMAFTKRKGWEVLIEAFAREFTATDPVELVLRTFQPGGIGLSQIHAQITAYIESLRLTGFHPPIHLVADHMLSVLQVRDLYRSADVVVLPSRGEGYGRPLLEALACGVPVITTGWGGQTDFVTEANGWLLDYDLVPAKEVDHPSFYGMLWAEPSLEHLRYCLREVLENPALRTQKAQEARQSVASYNREVVADDIMQHLAAIEGTRARSLGQESSKSGQFTPALVPPHLWQSNGAADPQHGPAPYQAQKQDNTKIDNALATSIRTVRASWIMLSSPYSRCGIRDHSQHLLDAGLHNCFDLLSYPSVWRSDEIDAALVHLHYSPRYVSASLLARFPPRGKLVATVHEVAGFEPIAPLFDAIVVHSQREYDYVKRMARKPDAALILMPLGCPVAARDQFVTSERRDPVLAYHGFLHPHKGLKELVTSYAQLRGRYPGAQLRILASQDAYDDYHAKLYLDECLSLAEKFDILDGVRFDTTFYAQADIVWRLHSETDLIVLPYVGSDNTGTSGSLRVALASGKPVIVTQQPCFEDVQEEVIKFQWASCPGMTEVLQSVWQQTDLQHKVVDQALKRVRQESWICIAERYMDIYRQL